MGEILIDEPDLIIDDPAGDCVDYWSALVKEDRTNNNIVQIEDTIKVNLFEKNTGYKKFPKEKKSDIRKKVKKILGNATFPPEQVRKAIEGYVQDPSLMEIRIDQVDPSNIFLFDVCSENFLTASEYERKGMLKPIEDVEFDWGTFQDCKELNLLSKHQDDFEPGELEHEEVPKRKSCRIERYESPERSKRRTREERSNNDKIRKYPDRRQDEQAKENEREKERDKSPHEKKRLVKIKDQRNDVSEEENGQRKAMVARKPSRQREKEQANEKDKMRRSASTEARDQDREHRFDKYDKEKSREKERDRSREKIGRYRSSSNDRTQEKRRQNYAMRRGEEGGYRQNFRFGEERKQETTFRNERYEERNCKVPRPYDGNQAQGDRWENRNNHDNNYGYQNRMNRNWRNHQRSAVIDIDEKESQEKNYRNYHDDYRKNKDIVIDNEDHQESHNSSKYDSSLNSEKPRPFNYDRRNNYQQENNFNTNYNHQFQAKVNEMGQFFMQMMTQIMVNQFSSNPNMANMMGQFMNGGNHGGFPNNRYHNQRPQFNNNNRRYPNNYNNSRGGFQKKPFYSRNYEENRRRRSTSDERNKEKIDWKEGNQRNPYDNDDKEVNEAMKRRNY